MVMKQNVTHVHLSAFRILKFWKCYRPTFASNKCKIVCFLHVTLWTLYALSLILFIFFENILCTWWDKSWHKCTLPIFRYYHIENIYSRWLMLLIFMVCLYTHNAPTYVFSTSRNPSTVNSSMIQFNNFESSSQVREWIYFVASYGDQIASYW